MHRAPPIFFSSIASRGFRCGSIPSCGRNGSGGRRLAGKAFDDGSGLSRRSISTNRSMYWPTSQKRNLRGSGIVLGGHRRAAENLQLVEFHRRERQRIDRCDLFQQHFVSLARQPGMKCAPRCNPFRRPSPRPGARESRGRGSRRAASRHWVDSMPNSTAACWSRAISAR